MFRENMGPFGTHGPGPMGPGGARAQAGLQEKTEKRLPCPSRVDVNFFPERSVLGEKLPVWEAMSVFVLKKCNLG